MSQWREPFAGTDGPPPIGVPPNPPLSVDLAPLLAELATLRTRVSALEVTQTADAALFHEHEERLHWLETRKLPALKLIEDPDADPLTTGSRFGHSHPVRWKVVPK